MKVARWSGSLVCLIATALIFASAGCGNKDGDGKKGTDKGADKVARKGDDHKDHKDHKDDAHKDKEAVGHGWWCAEHGVPESLCSLCLPDDEVKKKFKDTGDWCKLHDRALSQCFKCDPSRYAKFEAMYVAKYGKKPERPPESEFKK